MRSSVIHGRIGCLRRSSRQRSRVSHHRPTWAVPQRPPRIFRDVSDLTGNEYFSTIDNQLRHSRKLILLCSPTARQSTFVDDEIRRFLEAQGARHIIPVLLDGIPNNEAQAGQDALMAFP